MHYDDKLSMVICVLNALRMNIWRMRQRVRERWLNNLLDIIKCSSDWYFSIDIRAQPKPNVCIYVYVYVQVYVDCDVNEWNTYVRAFVCIGIQIVLVWMPDDVVGLLRFRGFSYVYSSFAYACIRNLPAIQCALYNPGRFYVTLLLTLKANTHSVGYVRTHARLLACLSAFILKQTLTHAK